jgi:putative ABC transport system permease protein
MTSVLLNTLLGVVILMAIATGVLWVYGVPHRWAPALAVARGVLQLAILSVVLTGVISNGYWVAAALLVMFGVAGFTATRRIHFTRDHALMVFTAMATGIVIALLVVFSTGTIDFTPRYVLAIGGIVIGNAMTIATLTGRRFTELVRDRWDQVEAWMSLGATPRQSTRDLTRDAVYAALIPTTDQTKTTGLVTLPGAFVGAIFGGVSPLEAGRFQIVVLASIMAVWMASVRVQPKALT